MNKELREARRRQEMEENRFKILRKHEDRDRSLKRWFE